MKHKEKQFDDLSSNDGEIEESEEKVNHNILEQSVSENSSFFQLFTASSLKAVNGERTAKQLTWDEQFANSFSISVLDTNFESSIVKLHYGNFRLLCNILFTNFPKIVFSSLKLLGTGSFGEVYEYFSDGECYAIKIINMKDGFAKGFSMELYKEYFLNCLASQLEVGPQVIPIFGYDLLITEKGIIFCMEKCSHPKPNKNGAIENELSQSLSVMHSLGFVHMDIKPENIAFSDKLQKHVFIDFGLSKLVKETIGQKSLTNFSGTLRYCSEEMKKCYILRQKILVDLYENDKYSLKKSLEELNTKSENSITELKQISLENKINEEDGYLLMSRFCSIIKLKFYIFQSNIPQICNLLEKCFDIPKCCCEIFSDKSIPKEMIKDKKLNALLKRMKSKMFCNLTSIKKSDEQIYIFINQQACSNIIQQSFPIEMIINMEKEKFIQIFHLPHWFIKMFVFIDPFESETIKEVSNEIWIQRKLLIEKIFTTFASNEQIEQSNRFPNFISLQTEFVLYLFYDRTKELKNVKMLLTLRLLFIATMTKFNKNIIQKIEETILELIDDKDELILRIINFYLFWKVYHYEEFDFENKHLNNWIKKVLHKNNPETDSCEKIEILEALLKENYLKLYEEITIEGENSTLKLLPENQNMKYVELIKNITYHLIYQINKFKKINFTINYHESSEFTIYASHKSNLAESISSHSRAYLKFKKIFIRFTSALFWEIYISNRNETIHLFSNFDNFILLYEVIGIDEQLFSLFFAFIKKKSITILTSFEIILKECYETSNEYNQMFINLCHLSTFLTEIESNLRGIEYCTQLSPLETEQIFDKTSLLLNFYREKCSKSIKKRIFEYKIKSIEIQLALKDNKLRATLTKKFVESIFHVNYPDDLLVRALMGILMNFEKEIEEIEGYFFEEFYFRDAFERFCDGLISSNGMSLCLNTLGMVLKLKHKKNKTEESFHYLFLYNKASSKFEDDVGMNMSFSVLTAYHRFFKEFDEEFLYSKYLEFVKNKQFNECIELHFTMYFRIKDKFSTNDRILAIHRLSMLLKSTKPLSFLMIRFWVLEESLKAILYKNEKQKGKFFKQKCLYLTFIGPEISNSWIIFNEIKIEKIKNKEIKYLLINKNNKYFINYSMIENKNIL